MTADAWHTLSWSELGNIPLRRTPLVSVSSVQYYAPDEDTLTTLDPSEYRVITTTEPGRIELVDSPPDNDCRGDAVQIEFVAGVSANTSATQKHAIKLLVAHLYEQRAPVAFSSCEEIPFTLRALIENQKVGGFC